jgi:hypothetical protein
MSPIEETILSLLAAAEPDICIGPWPVQTTTPASPGAPGM